MSQTVQKTIIIQAFGVAKDILGHRKIEWKTTLPKSVEDLKGELLQRFPAFMDINGFQLAIGEQYGQDEDIIDGTEEVSIIPPVSGG